MQSTQQAYNTDAVLERAETERQHKAAACQTMAHIRYEIDRLDRALVELMAERLTYIERAGYVKPERDQVRDPARIEDVVTKVLATARDKGLPTEIAEPVWRTLIEQCIAHEFDVFDARG